LHEVKPITLLTTLLNELKDRHHLDTSKVDDIVLGCVTPIADQGGDIAKTAAIAAGWDNDVAGVQINRFCASDVDFVNKGAASEMFAGLELVKNHDCFQKAEMYYWQNLSRGTNAEIDFLEAKDGMVLPIEVKATTRGSMQSLWLFMRKKALHHAVRTSLENFGEFEYVDKESQDAIRHVDVIPLYAMSNLCKLSVDTEMKIATP
jgi:hypothetical protein